MAFTETIGVTEINVALEEAFGDRLRWQMSEAEYDDRIDEAAHRAFDILNRPYLEDDLTDAELVEASVAYDQSLKEARAT